jgi:hypothetical protein
MICHSPPFLFAHGIDCFISLTKLVHFFTSGNIGGVNLLTGDDLWFKALGKTESVSCGTEESGKSGFIC